MTIYLPTILILCIVYATNFFKEFFFEAVVTVNLTALLVLTTLFIGVSESLPPTAYVKMVDIWLIFAQVGCEFFSNDCKNHQLHLSSISF